MDYNSTPLISFRDISVDNIDLLEDAWGINSQFLDVINMLGELNVTPSDRLTKDLIELIKRLN